MAYEPKTWECGEIITAEDLNHIENGIANAGGGGTPLIVSFDRVERDSSGPVPATYAYYDKTWQEISDALATNRPVYIKYGKFNMNNEYIEEDSSLVPIFRASDMDGEYGVETLDLATVDAQLRELFAPTANEQIRLLSGSIG